MSKQNEKIILDFLKKENRPFNAQDLVARLDGKLPKTAIAKTLDELAAEKKINEKVYNKQKIYMALQDVDVSNFKLQLRQLDEKAIMLNSELIRLKPENDRLEASLRSFEKKLPLSTLEKHIGELNAEIERLNGRLESLKASGGELMSKQEKDKIKKEHEKYAREWRKLKRIAKEIMDTVMENCNMKKDQLCEDLGIVLDEHENVQPPSI